ncbi:tRNA-splicing endonuclease subunit Sen34-like [Mizuhopecten yessoensis]|uniref:tRNA-splicing endonuclease subunit Sen34-like n=1 Tax=Mizuhopecten yessoensis TaxID=6573 RepID=UPI000B458112|nr:tRNA-splicing endonuclease subunit Sen34-like [Mizuhopecten yessoensis]
MEEQHRIKLFVCSDNVLVWNAEDVSFLRDEMRVVGNQIGCLPRFPRQNSFLGLPLLLMPEEVSLLLNKGVADLEKGDNPLETPTQQQIEEYHQLCDESYKEQVELFREERKREIEQNLPKIIDGKKEKRRKEIEEKKKAGEEVDESELDKEITIDVDSIPIPSLPRNHALVQLFTESPWKGEKSGGDMASWNFPSTEKEKIRCRVFQDLWEKGNFLTSGAKFGGDFLVYPGDPGKFHSHYVAICMEHQKNLTPLDLVAMGRLGSNVKKTVVLCSLDQEDHLQYTSLQWTGIT